MDSFEQFIAEHVSILKHRIIQITGFRSDFIDTKSIDIELDDNVVRINCINNENASNLLSSVIYKRKMNQLRQLNSENKEREISSQLS